MPSQSDESPFAVQGKLPCTYIINPSCVRVSAVERCITSAFSQNLEKMTTSSLRRITPKDFDAARLEKLVMEGRVYVDYPRVINNDAYKREVLDYVRAIDGYASEKWLKTIGDLWAQIVGAECFKPCLAMKKGLQAGHLNRYTVTNLVCRLQSLGVYRRDVPMLTLHLTLEQTDKRNKYYCSCGNYCLTKEARELLRQLLRKV